MNNKEEDVILRLKGLPPGKPSWDDIPNDANWIGVSYHAEFPTWFWYTEYPPNWVKHLEQRPE